MGFTRLFPTRGARRILLCLATCVLVPFCLTAEDTAVEGPYTIGIARLEDRGLPSAFSGFPASWSLLLVRLLSDLPPRMPDVQELAEITVRERAIARREAGDALWGSLDERAAKELEPGLVPRRRAALVEAAELKVEESRIALEELDSAPAQDTTIAEPRPAALWKDHAGGALIESSMAAAPDTARSQKLSLLVTGAATPAPGGYISLSLSLWDAEKERLVLERREFCNAADPDPSAMAEAIRRYVAGRPYARLEIAPDPKSSRVTLDGDDVTESERFIYRFDDATFDLLVEAPGRLAVTERITLTPGDRRVFNPILEPASQNPVSLSSEPDGARIFLDGLPVGNAPLYLELGAGKSVLRAEAEGFEGTRMVVDAPIASPVIFSLVPTEGDGSAGRLSRAKDSFYASLGWFVVGMAGQALARGVADGLGSVAERSAATESITAASVASGANIAALVSLGLLFVNSGWHLFAYIGAAH